MSTLQLKLNIVSFFVIFIIQNNCHSIEIITEHNPPYQYYNTQGNHSGFSIELMSSILKSINIPYHFSFYPWSRAYKEAQLNKKAILMSINKSTSRDKDFIWGVPISKEAYYLWGDSPLNNKKSLTASLCSKNIELSVAVTRASIGDHFLSNKACINLQRVNNYEQSIAMFLKGRVGAIIGTEIDIRLTNVLHKNRLKKLSNTPVFESEMYFAFNKSFDKEMIIAINTSFNKLKKSGYVNKLRCKWKLYCN